MGTYNDLIEELRQRVGNRTDIDTRLGRWLNDAYFDLLHTPKESFWQLDTSVTFQTTAAAREYDISGYSNLWFILGIRDETNEREITKWSWKDFDRRRHTSGMPIRYARFGSSLYLDPTPDAAYTLLLRYRLRVSELSAGSETIVGREWDEPLLHLAAAKAYNGLELFNEAGKQQQLYEAFMHRRQDQEMLEDADAEPTITVYRG